METSKTDSYGNERTNDPSGKYLISGLRQMIGGQKSESQLTLIRDVFFCLNKRNRRIK